MASHGNKVCPQINLTIAFQTCMQKCRPCTVSFFTREPRNAAQSTCDFVVVVESLPKIGSQLAGNGLHLQPCSAKRKRKSSHFWSRKLFTITATRSRQLRVEFCARSHEQDLVKTLYKNPR